MLVRRFLAWVNNAPAARRAEGAAALARAFLSGNIPLDEEPEAVAALTALLDDASPLVRRALAESLADSAAAPHHLVAALATDQSEIAALVLARSPLLTDAELIDCAAIGDVFAQSAIAIRPHLSAPVAAAVAEVGAREALIALAVNLDADLPEFSVRRMIERMGSDGELREALLARPGLTPAMRHELVVAAATALSDFVAGCGWLSPERARRVVAEAGERAIIAIGAGADDPARRALVRHLRRSGALTAGLALRAVLSQDLAFFAAVLAELSGMPAVRVGGLVREPAGAGFAALYGKAGLPPALLAVFRVALTAAHESEVACVGSTGPTPSRHIIARVLAECCATNGGSHRLLALLRRLDTEAAREEAREMRQALLFAPEAPKALPYRPPLSEAREILAWPEPARDTMAAAA